MNDRLRNLRADVDAEMAEASDIPVAAADLAIGQMELLLGFFEAEAPSDTFDAGLDALMEAVAWPEAPAGRAAIAAKGPQSAGAMTVGEAFSAPMAIVRSAIVAHLGLNREAAELLLDRPAAALLTFPPGAVAITAEECRTPRGELFGAIADSSRMSGGFVYAYRPGPARIEPAKRVEEGDSMAALITWGRELFELPERTS